jgi:hypothetical protein
MRPTLAADLCRGRACVKLRSSSGRPVEAQAGVSRRCLCARPRQSDWAYSKPVVVLDIIWNFAFVLVATTVLVLSRSESPTMPLWLWLISYALQCVLHMVCVCVEYRRRQRRRRGRVLAFNSMESGVNSSPAG